MILSNHDKERIGNKEWRINHLYKIRNKQSELIQYKRNRAQQHFADNAWSRNIILKSRQLGFTTEESIDTLDDVLFHRNYDALLIGHNLDAAKKIFSDKVEFAWKNIPEAIQNLYAVDSSTAQTLKFDFGDKTFSSVIVDTSGRSGTFQRVHVTEFADICKKYPEKAREIIEGTIPAVPTHGRVDFESTAQGAFGKFHDMFMEAWRRGQPTRPIEYKSHFYNWTWDDEELNKTTAEEVPQEFVEYQKIYNLTDVQITYYFYKWLSLNKNWNALKREYPTTPEEAFEASVEGAYYASELQLALNQNRIKLVPYDETLKVHTVWDLGVGSNLVCGMFQRVSNEIKLIDIWQGSGDMGIIDGLLEIKKKPYFFGKHFFPHDVEAREETTGKSRKEMIEKAGFIVTVVPEVGIHNGIEAAKVMFRRLWINEENCQVFIDAISQYRREWDDKKGMFKVEPLHDWTSHACFTGDTKIKTYTGDIKVKNILEGDTVLTPAGDAIVLEKKNMGIKSVYEFFGMRVTANHPFLTQRGFVSLDMLRYSDKIVVCKEKLLSLMDLNSIDIRNRLGEKIEVIIAAMRRVRKSRSIGIYGKRNLGKYLLDFMFTIKTVIHLIMNLVILRRYLLMSIVVVGMEKKLGEGENEQLKLHKNMQGYGINQKREMSFINNLDSTQNSYGSQDISKLKENNVKCAEMNTKLLGQQGQSSVEIIVKLPHCGEEEVYNLRTSKGIYQAEGVVVSNSDMLRYAAVSETMMTNTNTFLTVDQREEMLFRKAMKKKKQLNYRV